MFYISVLVAGLRSPRVASARLIDAAERKQILALPCFASGKRSLKRPEHLAAAGVSSEDIDEALDELAGFIVPAEKKFSWRPQLADADDEMVLQAALGANSSVIVIFELRAFRAPARHFGIEVLTPPGLCGLG